MVGQSQTYCWRYCFRDSKGRAQRPPKGCKGSITGPHTPAGSEQTKLTGAGNRLGAPLDLEFAVNDAVVPLDGGERKE